MRAHLIKRTLVCVWLLSCVTICLAQEGRTRTDAKTKPDISGRWTLDTSKGNLGPLKDTPLATASVTMVIEVNGPEVRFSKNMIVDGQEHIGDWTYYTDGRGESNSVFPGSNSTLKTMTVWRGSKIFTTVSLDMNVAEQAIHVEGEETWELTRDRKTLINTISKRNSMGVESMTFVYRRTP